MNRTLEALNVFEKENSSAEAFSTHSVVSTDGTRIGYLQMGRGPGLVIMHGGIRAAHHYLDLGRALAGSYTVILPDRRGRGMSGTPGPNYSIDKELEDLTAVLRRTGATSLFGHSGGGFFALEAALRLPVKKLALYEPAVSIHGSMPMDWFAKFQKALGKNDPAAAFVILFKGLQLHPLSRLPGWVFLPFVQLMLRGEEGRELADLLPTGLWEIGEIQRLAEFGLTYERYQHIQARTLLLNGSKSPEYLRLAARTLAETIPHAKQIELPGLDHNAPDQNAAETVATELMQFLL